MAETLLEVEDLSVEFRTEDGIVHAVDGVSFTLERGEVLGIVRDDAVGTDTRREREVQREDRVQGPGHAQHE